MRLPRFRPMENLSVSPSPAHFDPTLKANLEATVHLSYYTPTQAPGLAYTTVGFILTLEQARALRAALSDAIDVLESGVTETAGGSEPGGSR